MFVRTKDDDEWQWNLARDLWAENETNVFGYQADLNNALCLGLSRKERRHTLFWSPSAWNMLQIVYSSPIGSLEIKHPNLNPEYFGILQQRSKHND